MHHHTNNSTLPQQAPMAVVSTAEDPMEGVVELPTPPLSVCSTSTTTSSKLSSSSSTLQATVPSELGPFIAWIQTHRDLIRLNGPPQLNVDQLLSALEELNSLVGMAEPKRVAIRQIKYYLRNGGRYDGHYRHTAIEGDPGTGKTTLGKVLVKIWASLGLFKTPSGADGANAIPPQQPASSSSSSATIAGSPSTATGSSSNSALPGNTTMTTATSMPTESLSKHMPSSSGGTGSHPVVIVNPSLLFASSSMAGNAIANTNNNSTTSYSNAHGDGKSSTLHSSSSSSSLNNNTVPLSSVPLWNGHMTGSPTTSHSFPSSSQQATISSVRLQNLEKHQHDAMNRISSVVRNTNHLITQLGNVQQQVIQSMDAWTAQLCSLSDALPTMMQLPGAGNGTTEAKLTASNASTPTISVSHRNKSPANDTKQLHHTTGPKLTAPPSVSSTPTAPFYQRSNHPHHHNRNPHHQQHYRKLASLSSSYVKKKNQPQPDSKSSTSSSQSPLNVSDSSSTTGSHMLECPPSHTAASPSSSSSSVYASLPWELDCSPCGDSNTVSRETTSPTVSSGINNVSHNESINGSPSIQCSSDPILSLSTMKNTTSSAYDAMNAFRTQHIAEVCQWKTSMVQELKWMMDQMKTLLNDARMAYAGLQLSSPSSSLEALQPTTTHTAPFAALQSLCEVASSRHLYHQQQQQLSANKNNHQHIAPAASPTTQSRTFTGSGLMGSAVVSSSPTVGPSGMNITTTNTTTTDASNNVGNAAAAASVTSATTTVPWVILSRSDFVADFMGQTGRRTRNVLDKNRGMGIFIDEAHTLFQDEKDTFGKEASSEILRYMDAAKEDTILTLATYPGALKNTMFKADRGLQRRIQWFFKIEGYTSAELAQIFIHQAQRFGQWSFDAETISRLTAFFQENKKRFPHYAGDSERLLYHCKLTSSERHAFQCLLTGQTVRGDGDPERMDDRVITWSDLITAFDEYCAVQATDTESSTADRPMSMYS